MCRLTEQQENDIKELWRFLDKTQQGKVPLPELKKYFYKQKDEEIVDLLQSFHDSLDQHDSQEIDFNEFHDALHSLKNDAEVSRILWKYLDSIRHPNRFEGLKRALLVVDVQNDFLPEAQSTSGRVFSGALAVQNGNQIIPLINDVRKRFDDDSNSIVVLSKDWHPEHHCSFQSRFAYAGAQLFKAFSLKKVTSSTNSLAESSSNERLQMMWPDHCIQNYDGAEIHPDLVVKDSDYIVLKGDDRDVDSYSAFMDNDRKRKTGLEDLLKQENVGTVYVCGVATDYCVRASCIHSVEAGFKTFVLLDACRGVAHETVREGVKEMCSKGVIPISSLEVPLKHK